MKSLMVLALCVLACAKGKDNAAPSVPQDLQLDIVREVAYSNGLRAAQDESAMRLQALKAKAEAACGAGYVIDEKQFQEMKFACVAAPDKDKK